MTSVSFLIDKGLFYFNHEILSICIVIELDSEISTSLAANAFDISPCPRSFNIWNPNKENLVLKFNVKQIDIIFDQAVVRLML